jgi:hypothetical protein
MNKGWKIIRMDMKSPRTIVRDVKLAIEPMPGDVLLLDLSQDELKGAFRVTERVIDSTAATVAVVAHKDG